MTRPPEALEHIRAEMAYHLKPRDDDQAVHTICWYLLGPAPTDDDHDRFTRAFNGVLGWSTTRTLGQRKIEVTPRRTRPLLVAVVLRDGWLSLSRARWVRFERAWREMATARDRCLARLAADFREMVRLCHDGRFFTQPFGASSADVAAELDETLLSLEKRAPQAPAKRRRGRPAWRQKPLEDLIKLGVPRDAARLMLSLLALRFMEREARLPWADLAK